MAFIGISENKRYLTKPNGQPFFVIGANYQGHFDRVWQMWQEGKFNLALIDSDFKKMAALGFNVVRLFVQTGLEADIIVGNFSKLDQVLQLAANHRLLVLLTLHDRTTRDLTAISEIDLKIVARYQDDPLILGWDLEHDLRFYQLAATTYPGRTPAPIQTDQLISHYGPRTSQQEALTLQNQHRIPSHLNPQQAFYYINALQYLLDFTQAAEAWASETNKTTLEYLASSDSEMWHPLIRILDDTLSTWLAARQKPIHSVDKNHLITLGHSWPCLLGLSANQSLDFQNYQRYGVASWSELTQTLHMLDSGQKLFPDQPMLLGKFGYANKTSATPSLSTDVSEAVTALFELGLLAYLRTHNFAGGIKWQLNDSTVVANPLEASLGVFRRGNYAKSIGHLLPEIKRSWPTIPEQGNAKIVQDPVGLAARFDVGNSVLLSGGTFQDEAISWQADTIAHCFIVRQDENLTIKATGTGRLQIDVPKLNPDWPKNREVLLSQVVKDSTIVQATFPAGKNVTWQLRSGLTYKLVVIETPSRQMSNDVDAEILPNAGEHVILLPDSDRSLNVALTYIRQFEPDLSFAPEQVVGRWPYVTVLATPEQISDATLALIKASGAQIVDRIPSQPGEDPGTTLAALVHHNRRFLSADFINPPDLPPSDSLPDGTDDTAEIYLVQPGDNLSKIARQVYGKASQWPLIFEANRDLLDKPGLIRPGMELKIPLQPKTNL